MIIEKIYDLNGSHNTSSTRYNNLKMSFLDKAKIGNSVKVNLDLTKDRLNNEIIDALNASSICKINDFKITDGKGIGLVLELSNGKEHWFFEDEIDLLDENGLVIKKIKNKKISNNLGFNSLRGLKYEHKNKIGELLNPVNFFIWVVVSFKDVF